MTRISQPRQNNPVLARLAKRTQLIRYPLDLTVVIAFNILSDAIIVGLFLDTGGSTGGGPQPIPFCCYPILLASLATFLLTPPALTAVSAFRASHDGDFLDQLKLTNVSERTILASYVGTTVYRLRPALVVGLGFIPLLMFSMTFGQTAVPFGRCITSLFGIQYCIPPFNDSLDYLYTMRAEIVITTAAVSICVLCLNMGAAIYGVWIATRMKSIMGYSAIMFFVGLLALVLAIELMLNSVTSVTNDHLVVVILFNSALSLVAILSVIAMFRGATGLLRRSG